MTIPSPGESETKVEPLSEEEERELRAALGFNGVQVYLAKPGGLHGCLRRLFATLDAERAKLSALQADDRFRAGVEAAARECDEQASFAENIARAACTISDGVLVDRQSRKGAVLREAAIEIRKLSPPALAVEGETLLVMPAPALDAPDVGCCEGCGSTKTMAEIHAGGHLSCCPERKMLTAKQWQSRALSAEAEVRHCRSLMAFGHSEECAYLAQLSDQHIAHEMRLREAAEADARRMREALETIVWLERQDFARPSMMMEETMLQTARAALSPPSEEGKEGEQ